jgi:hypothetical protein
MTLLPRRPFSEAHPPALHLGYKNGSKPLKESVIRRWEAEDALVGRAWGDPLAGLPELIEVAAQAVDSCEAAIKSEVARRGLWISRVGEEQRRMVCELQKLQPADSDTVARAALILRELLECATLDEIAMAAVNALQSTAVRAGVRVWA